MSEPGPRLVVRPFQIDDQAAVRALILDGLNDHFPQLDESLNPDLDDIVGNYLQKGCAFIVAELNGHVIGTGALRALEANVGQIVRVSVARQHRRRGIGMAIVSRLLALAHESGYERLVVETNSDWFEAIALYDHFGFHTYDRDEVSVYMCLSLDSQT